MNLARKLREVVAANFIEIARVDTPPVEEEKSTPSVTPPVEALTSAEAELDSYLKDIEAAASADTRAYTEAPPVPVAHPNTAALAQALSPAAVAPPVVAVAPVVVEPAKPEPILAHLADAVSEKGDVDFDRIYKQYELPVPSFSAEQAMNMLQALPRDLPLRTKRVTVNTTLSAIGQVVGATPGDIVQDAKRKRQQLDKYLASLTEEIRESTATVEAEIAELQQQIAQKREGLRTLNRKGTAASEVCQSRVQLFEQVVHFFDYDEAALSGNASAPEEAAQADPDDMPAFMREDAVRRMLGITEEEGGEFDPVKFAAIYGTGDEPGETPAAGPADGADGSSGKSRRRNGSRQAEPVS